MATIKNEPFVARKHNLITVGFVFWAAYQVYAPRVVAFGKAFEAFAKSHNYGSPPSLEAYGLTEQLLFIMVLLGNVGSILVFIGAAYLIILFIGKIIRQLGAPL